MKQRFYILIFLISLFTGALLLNSCRKEYLITHQKKPTVEIPDLETSSASVYEDGEITLSGKINKVPINIKQYGFAISTDSLMDNPVYHRVIDDPSTGIFKLDINSTITKNIKYYYSTYAVIGDSSPKIYGVRAVASTESKQVKIISIHPLKADMGDTLAVKGKYFKGQELHINFNNKPADIFNITHSSFKLIVPKTIKRSNPLIIFSNATQTDTITDKFSLYAPVIANFTTVATFGDTITINGAHLNDAADGAKVSFNNIEARLITSTPKQLKVIVPDNIQNTNTSITVKAQFQKSTGTAIFKIAEPVITAITPSGYMGDVIKIEGKNFNPIAKNNSVFFDGHMAEIKAASNKQLLVTVPSGSYPRKTAIVTLKMLDYVKTAPVAFKVSTAIKPGAGLDIYILAGQSNMSGRGPITEEFKNVGSPDVFMLNADNKWIEAAHPLHFDRPEVNGVGPGLTFGIEMSNAKPGVLIGLIPCAVGGSEIELWRPGVYNKTRNRYIYDDAEARIKFAMQFGTIKGIIWHQGESNSSENEAKNYLAQLKKLIENMRGVAGNSKLPFVAGELPRYADRYAYINAVLKKLPNVVPYTAVVSSEGLTHKGDFVHFSNSSYQELGKRFALKMLALQK